MTVTETPVTTAAEERQALIAAHRLAADLIEQHPEINPPTYVTGGGGICWTLYSWNCPDGIPAMIAAIRRAVGGKWDKTERESYGGQAEMVFSREGYEIVTKREAVCVRRVVGTETKTIPARPALPARPATTETIEIIEWDCEPVLAGESA